jgi:hypothetical protein
VARAVLCRTETGRAGRLKRELEGPGQSVGARRGSIGARRAGPIGWGEAGSDSRLERASARRAGPVGRSEVGAGQADKLKRRAAMSDRHGQAF